MSDNTVFSGMLQDPEVRLAFEQEWVLQEFLCQLERHMTDKEINRSELARRLGVKPSWVTQLFREDSNPTLETMVRVAHAAGLRFCLTLAPLGAVPRPVSTQWRSLHLLCGDPLAVNDPGVQTISALPAEEQGGAGLDQADTRTTRVRWVSANRQGRCLRCASRAYDAYLLEEKMPTTKKILSRPDVQAARAAAAPPPAAPPPQRWSPRLPKVPPELHHPEPPELRCLARLQELGALRAPVVRTPPVPGLPEGTRPPRRKWGRSKTVALLFAGAALGAAVQGDAHGAAQMLDLAGRAEAGGAL